jgi:hypothetical protein
MMDDAARNPHFGLSALTRAAEYLERRGQSVQQVAEGQRDSPSR